MGLGAGLEASEVTVDWPSGMRSHLAALAADARYTVVEGGDGAVAAGR